MISHVAFQVFSSDDVVAAHLVKHEHDLAKLIAKRDSLLQLQRKAQQVFEKTQTLGTGDWSHNLWWLDGGLPSGYLT